MPRPRKTTRQSRADARLRRALAHPPGSLALVCESHPARCSALARALSALGPTESVWSRADVLEAAARARPRVVVFGASTAKLADFAAPRRLRALAPHVHLILVTWGTARIAAEPRALFAAVVESEREAAFACERLTAPSAPSAPAATPAFFVRPAEGAAPDAVADALAEAAIARINAERRARGLPPLKK